MLKTFNCLKGVRSRFKLRHVNFFLLLSVLCLWLIGFPSVVAAQVVDIPDPGLRAAIAEALGKAPGDAITRADMETLIELRAYARDITDLRGIEFAVNLTGLDLWINNISDISPLSNLINLTRLGLEENNISDISPLSNLINLTELYLSNNNISDISPLSNLINLTRLYLWFNNISDISPLSNLINLRTLDLWINNISDISPLSNLINLTRLDLGENNISDISPLSNLINLEQLYLNNNNISDISPLSSLINLRTLYLGKNNISDISPLASLINLTYLRLFSNNISDISPLASLINLTYLNLGANNISDIVPLITLTNLTHLHLHSNNISDIETLELLMAQGTVVYFRGNPAFETPGPKIEDGWVWLIVPATDVRSGSAAARSGRDFLAEASGGAVTEADVALIGAQAGTRVGDSVWTAATLDPTDRNNLGAISRDYNLGRDFRFPVAYGVVPIQSETQQQTRVYIGGGPLKVWFNGTLVHRDTTVHYVDNYQTAVPVQLVPGENLLFVSAYRQSQRSTWGAFFGFQDGTIYTAGAPGPGGLDVNGDGEVTVIDLAIVALFYGTQVPVGVDLPADVNTDGVVNILDLTAVAQGIDAARGNAFTLNALKAALTAAVEIEAIAEAPMLGGTRPDNFRDILYSGNRAYRNVADALADAGHLEPSIPAVLTRLLQLLKEMGETPPETTALLPNYPNPFNPETWIPYHLANASRVQITIFDTRSTVVRKLDLGHQQEGYYTSKVRAAYWDGRNESGEPVASGVYFYTLTAGDFNATRKLLIAK